MYLKHFGLDRKPFEQLPDPDFLFLSEQHQTALSNIGFAVAIQDSFVVVTGEIGSGKTTLLHQFLSEKLADATVAYVTQTRLSATELLQSILFEFGEQPFGKGKVELTTMLKQFIASQHRDGKRVVIVIDEAQNLTPGALEELRLVTCLPPGSGSLINVVLVGQPQFNRMLDSPALEQLRQRCRLRYHLKALSEDETRLYMVHRLAVAGGSYSEIFEPGLDRMIFQYTRGIPRLINMLCDTALIFALVRDCEVVGAEQVRQAVTEMGWSRSNGPAQPVNARLGARTADAHGSLAVLVDAVNGREYPIMEPVSVVGRAKDCSVRINHPGLSRYHAMIKRVGDDWSLRDMKSLNGVYVNGQRVRAARLQHNDNLAFGDHNLVFRLPHGPHSADDGTEDVPTETPGD
jgi:type II secretory pathway predicted ATPase ExeA